MTEKVYDPFCIGFCSGLEVSLPFFNSVLLATRQTGCGVVSVMGGPVLHRSRNELARLFMEDKGGKVDRMVMIDTDIVFGLRELAMLLDHDESVVRGVYANQIGEPVIEGCGFVAIKRRVFHNLGDYPFNPVPISTGEMSGEDVGFYARCRKAGIEVVTDMNIVVGHIKPQVLMLGQDNQPFRMNSLELEEPVLQPA